MYDVVVIGAGHAGIEAALATARLNHKTLLVTGDIQNIASLPCNPSIGGPAKGIVVREIDALGGEMAKAADLARIQIKMLNSSKGLAVRALRAQIDKVEYTSVMATKIKNTKNLFLEEGLVTDILIDDNTIKGVVLGNREIAAQIVIIATGTYLNSRILIGDEITYTGPGGAMTTSGISKRLASTGFEIIRLKTGTPPRIKKDTIDYESMITQPGEELSQGFSFLKVAPKVEKQENCYLTHTNIITHEIINKNLTKSAMYGGIVEGIGPRYCPSIEDKVVRFSDKDKHQVFVEPESLSIDEMYLQGLSTSMPKDVQKQIVNSVKGLERAIINKYAYAIEYDAVNPLELKQSLETKKVNNLFLAGQINGTSGYEEAACQGLMAGINASRKINNQEPFILRRDEAYIGVLIDDLVTKGTKEPYRLLTSRAEYRLFLRHDNADLRLMEHGYHNGLIEAKRYQDFLNKKNHIRKILDLATNMRIAPSKDLNDYLISRNSSPIRNKVFVRDLIKRVELDKDDIKYFLDLKDIEDAILEEVDIQIKYNGYILKMTKEVEKSKRLENKKIPNTINYDLIKNLSSEAREKLKAVRPRTIGQATRILGVNPTDISILVIYIEYHNHRES